MTVFIHYQGSPNFPVLLVQLQPQLSEDDDIYIVDSSPNREGLRLAKLYGSTRCYIFVEVGKYDWKDAWEFALQNMKENKQEGLLHLSEDLVISSTFISNMKKAAKSEFKIIYPIIWGIPYSKFPPDFRWYNSPKPVVNAKLNGISITCFYQKAESGEKIGLLDSETVVLIPTNPEDS